MSIVPVFAETTAAPDTTVPAAGIVRNEAQLTASYLMANTDFTQISDTSTFYNASRNLLLSIRSGYNCSEQVNTYLNSVKALVNTEVFTAVFALPERKIALAKLQDTYRRQSSSFVGSLGCAF